MTAPADDLDGLLQELTVLPREQRLAHLRAVGPLDETLPRLADEIARWAVQAIGPALEAGGLLVELADLSGGVLARARARWASGQTLAYAGRFQEAEACYCEAVRIAESAGLELEAARARMSSIHALASLGRYDEAVRAGEAARQSFAAAGDFVSAAKADSNLGATHRLRDDPAAALRHLDRARPHLSGDPLALAQLDSNRGYALMNLDRFEEAEAVFLGALPCFQQAGMAWAAAIVMSNLAQLCARQGRLQEALAHFEQTLRYLEQDDAPAETARVRIDRADTLVLLGLAAEARDDYEAALPVLLAEGMRLEAARAQGGLGGVLVGLGEFTAADAVLRSAADTLAGLDHETARAGVLRHLAESAAAQGRLELARDLAGEALTGLKERPVEIARTGGLLARIALQGGDGAAASRALEAALQQAEALRITPLMADLRSIRGRMALARGAPADAVIDYHAAIELIERVRGSLHAERFRSAFHGDRLAIYHELITAALAAGDPVELFWAVERAKSRSLLDLVRGVAWPADVLRHRGPAELGTAPARYAHCAAEDELAQELARLQSELNIRYSRLADVAAGLPGSAPRERWQAEIEAAELRLTQIEARLQTTRGASSLAARPADAAEVQARLPAGTALLEYFAAAGQMHALVLTSAGVQPVGPLGPLAELAEGVRRVHFQMRRALRPDAAANGRLARRTADAQRELRRLHEVLLRPLEPALCDVARFVIVPHGPLHALPFHALWDGHRYLIERGDVWYSPSASLFRSGAPAGPADGRDGAALVAGVSDERAPLIEAEAREVAARLNAATLLLGSEATAAAVRHALERSTVAHLACHGVFPPGRPLAAGVKLFDDWLTVGGFLRLRLGCRLITLSGCETGRTAVGTGDELYGLVRALLAAGAAAVLVSLWTVGDASTRELMFRFYSQWRYTESGEGPAAALRKAQLDGCAQRTHPAFWAPFILVGEG